MVALRWLLGWPWHWYATSIMIILHMIIHLTKAARCKIIIILRKFWHRHALFWDGEGGIEDILTVMCCCNVVVRVVFGGGRTRCRDTQGLGLGLGFGGGGWEDPRSVMTTYLTKTYSLLRINIRHRARLAIAIHWSITWWPSPWKPTGSSYHINGAPGMKNTRTSSFFL